MSSSKQKFAIRWLTALVVGVILAFLMVTFFGSTAEALRQQPPRYVLYHEMQGHGLDVSMDKEVILVRTKTTVIEIHEIPGGFILGEVRTCCGPIGFDSSDEKYTTEAEVVARVMQLIKERADET